MCLHCTSTASIPYLKGSVGTQCLQELFLMQNVTRTSLPELSYAAHNVPESSRMILQLLHTPMEICIEFMTRKEIT